MKLRVHRGKQRRKTEENICTGTSRVRVISAHAYKKTVQLLVKNIHSESPLLKPIATTWLYVEKEEKFYYSTNWFKFPGSNYLRKNPLYTLLKKICQKWKITSLPILIYQRCICSNKTDLNPCVQESLGQHDMEATEPKVPDPVCFPLLSLLVWKWADSVSTSCHFVAPAASLLPEQDKQTTLWKTFSYYD